MPETVEDNPADKVNELSEEEFAERFERDMDNFEDKLKEYSGE
ncbi:MAG: hypothetical protein ABEJ03_05885 [Candidatus Nanohaloarchaea archaeon]